MKLKTILTQKFEKKAINQKLSKYISAFDYVDKTLIVLSATSGGVSTISFASVIGVPAGIASAIFTLVFYLIRGIIKKVLQITRNREKKPKEILVLAKTKTKLNSIETLVTQALIDREISLEEFKTIVNEKEKYEKMN